MFKVSNLIVKAAAGAVAAIILAGSASAASMPSIKGSMFSLSHRQMMHLPGMTVPYPGVSVFPPPIIDDRSGNFMQTLPWQLDCWSIDGCVPPGTGPFNPPGPSGPETPGSIHVFEKSTKDDTGTKDDDGTDVDIDVDDIPVGGGTCSVKVTCKDL